MDVGRKKDFAEAVKQVEEIYPNIAVLSQLANYLEDPNTNIDDLARLIRSEPALTADIIKISNSSFYAAAFECADVDSALTRIGFNEVLRVVALILARDLCSNDLEKYGMSANELWAESVTVSLLMEELARAIKLNRAEAATLGILHCVGRVVINNILEEFRIDIYWDPSIPVVDWEETVVGFHYGEAGGRFLKQMKFPNEAQQVIRYHVEPEKSNRPNPMILLLNYAVKLAAEVGQGFSKPKFEIPELPQMERFEDISEEDIREMIFEAKSRFKQITKEVFSK